MTSSPFETEVLWRPAEDAHSTSVIGRYMTWLATERGLVFTDYQALWDWSVEDLDAFWRSIRDYFDLPISASPHAFVPRVDGSPAMGGAQWFGGATLNDAAHLLHGAGRAANEQAIVACSQTRPDSTLTWAQLRAEVARVRRALHACGVGRGDRVVAYAPNIPETLIAFLATASLGAVWSSCAPEFGVQAVLDRFRQITPKVLFTIDGYRYGRHVIDRRDEVAEIRDALDSLRVTIHIGYLDPGSPAPSGSRRWEDIDGDVDPGVLPVAFDHPLYVLYSSGTTGLPKPIIHGHGGILVEHHKALALHGDIGPGDRFFWFTTTGWMMWNYLVSGLGVGATIVLFDGDPGSPSLDVLWRLAEDCRITSFGVSAPFIDACRHADLHPGRDHDLSSLRSVGSTGAPLVADAYRWIYSEVADDVVLGSISGGTDVCTAFVGAVPVREVQAGVIPCRYLGAKVEAFAPDGSTIVDREGELVVTAPMPSMPIGLWGDTDNVRIRASYFDRFPGVWWHGDWITIAGDGRCIISGRSDATLNRGGVRLGTADFYAVVESSDQVADSLVIHLEDPEGGPGELVLFVVPSEGSTVDEVLEDHLRQALRSRLSPRHVPDRIETVAAIPRTLSGKKLEVPVKRLLQGMPIDEVLTLGALANPESVRAFEDFAHRYHVDR